MHHRLHTQIRLQLCCGAIYFCLRIFYGRGNYFQQTFRLKRINNKPCYFTCTYFITIVNEEFDEQTILIDKVH